MRAMTHRERVMAAVNHKEPDRVPVDIGATRVTSIHRVAYANLVKHLGLPPKAEVLWDRNQQIILPDEEVLTHFDVDTRSLFQGPPANFKPIELGEGVYKDEWGVVRKMPEDGFYYDIVESPLCGEPTLEDLDRFPWPDPDDPGIVRGLRERADELHNQTDYAVVFHSSAAILHFSQYLRGFEGWFTDVALRPDFMGALMDRILDIHLRTIRNIFNEIGEHVLMESPAAFMNEKVRRRCRYVQGGKPVDGSVAFMRGDGNIICVCEVRNFFRRGNSAAP